MAENFPYASVDYFSKKFKPTATQQKRILENLNFIYLQSLFYSKRDFFIYFHGNLLLCVCIYFIKIINNCWA